MSQNRRILVTSALPYANGPLHLGHIIEAVQTDIWCRFQRARGHDCIYVCAEDCHGTPIMIRAKQEGITPEALIEKAAAEHQRDYAGFSIALDHFHSTHSEENQRLCNELYQRLVARGSIYRRTIRQAYDEQAGMFLPDRFVRGTCPHCGTADQYGDSCESCGGTYSPVELKDAVSTVTGSRPVLRDSEHLFFRLGDYAADLRAWLDRSGMQPAVRAKLDEWFQAGLSDWDISRDAPYFGFEIPDAPGKYFYVWFDAPIGYMGSFAALAAKRGLDFDAYWKAGATTELHHFIGKDISYFHTLFWPAVLQGAGCRRPTGVHVHGFLTVDGQKMSKSRGNVVSPDDLVAQYGADTVRTYLMFFAKWDQGGPWNYGGIKGPQRFLQDVWDLALHDYRADVVEDEATRNLRRKLHQTIQKVGEDLESFSFNTAVAALMELRNAVSDARQSRNVSEEAWNETIETSLRLLAPFAPHMSEELWERRDLPYSIHEQQWPEWDAEVAREETITLIVQVNGKVRGKFAAPMNAPQAELEKLALADDNVQRFIAGKEVVKVIVVPNKLVNIVVKG